MKEVNCCNTALLKVNGSEYAFDFINYEIMKIDENDKAVFHSLIKEKRLPEDTAMRKNIMKIMLQIKKGYYFTERPIRFTKDEVNKDYIISFPIVHKCNLRCKYCFADGGRVYHGENKYTNKETLGKIYKFIDNYSSGKAKRIRLEFVSGGETLLSKEKYIENIMYMQEEAIKSNMNLEVFTLTNGTLLDGEMVDFINKNRIELGISLDGPSEIHNYQRPFADGSDSYGKIISNIENSILKDNRENNMWVVSVVTSYTKSLIDIMNHNKSLGTTTAEMRVVRGKDQYGLAMNKENIGHFIGLYDELAEYLKENTEDLKIILNRYDTFGKILARLLTKQNVIYRCQAGKTKFSFTADGDIYPCDSFVGIEKFKIGNLHTNEMNTEVMEKFENSHVHNLNRCQNCQYKYLCGGDCYYNQFKVSDTENSDVFCEFQKHLCELAVDIIYHIKANSTEQFNELRNFVRIRELF